MCDVKNVAAKNGEEFPVYGFQSQSFNMKTIALLLFAIGFLYVLVGLTMDVYVNGTVNLGLATQRQMYVFLGGFSIMTGAILYGSWRIVREIAAKLTLQHPVSKEDAPEQPAGVEGWWARVQENQFSNNTVLAIRLALGLVLGVPMAELFLVVTPGLLLWLSGDIHDWMLVLLQGKHVVWVIGFIMVAAMPVNFFRLALKVGFGAAVAALCLWLFFFLTDGFGRNRFTVHASMYFAVGFIYLFMLAKLPTWLVQRPSTVSAQPEPSAQ